MKALVYRGAKDVRIDDKPKPEIKEKEDIILYVTSSALCESDFHFIMEVTRYITRTNTDMIY
jgi:S-(hydroxymethyl)glutathione dehydrogenase/alcohol dehydrogenase